MRLCLPDLNVRTKQSFLYHSPGLRHTVHSLDSLPISTEASSVQIILSQSVIVHRMWSFAHCSLFACCLALIKGFLAAMCLDMPRRVFRVVRTVLGLTGDGNAELIVWVIFVSDWCRSWWIVRLRCRTALSLSLGGRPDRGAFS